jgi:hypothetical protein
VAFPDGLSRLDLASRFGRLSDQYRFADNYREGLQKQNVASDAIQRGMNAPGLSIDAQNNPLNGGSVFRQENPGIASAYDQQAQQLRRKQDEEQQQQAFMQQQRRMSLLRDYNDTGVVPPGGVQYGYQQF